MAFPGTSGGHKTSFVLATIVLLIAVTADRTVAAEARIALVIGNAAYASQPLTNPANDATLMAKTLRQVGFDVIEEVDADRRTMQRALRNFSRKLARAGNDSVGLFYYAGHGIQARGENYMIPVDARIEDALDVEFEGVPASNMLSSLDHAGNRLNIVILDACRNNPYRAATRSGGTGLARMDAPSGTLIAYSTAPGKVAADGRQRNSPYTRALARAIATPGAKVEDVFKTVRVAVMDRTGGAQVPWESSSLTGDFYFIDRAPEPVAQPEPAPEPEIIDNSVEITFWEAIKDSVDPALFDSYLSQYPDGLFAVLAKAKAASLRRSANKNSERAFFNAIKDSENEADFHAFLRQWPDGTFAPLAKARVEALAKKKPAAVPQPTVAPKTDPDTAFWNQVKDSGAVAELRAYLDQYPNGAHAALAAARIKGIEDRRRLAETAVVNRLHPMDGQWKIRWEVLGGSWAGEGFCSAGETAETVVTVFDGEYSSAINSSKGYSGRVQGTFVQGGKIRIKYRSMNWSFGAQSTLVSVSEDRGERRVSGNTECGPFRFTVTRLLE